MGHTTSDTDSATGGDDAGALDPVWLHCSIGAEMTDGEAEAEDMKTQVGFTAVSDTK